jgi:type IV secretory pathway VirB4 component
MTNNKQQTAVEWQFEQLFNSFEKFNNSEYTFDEYLKRNLEIREQAKEMEKQRSQAYAAFCVKCDREKLPLLEFEDWIKLEESEQ